MNAIQFRKYQTELVGDGNGANKRLADLLGTSEVGVKRFATDGRPIPDYIAQSMRALVLLQRNKMLDDIKGML